MASIGFALSKAPWPIFKTATSTWRSLTIKRFLSLWLPVVGLCLLIFIESSRPTPDLSPDIPLFDKFLHLMTWAFLAGLFFRAYAATAPLSRHAHLLLWLSFISAAIYGVSDEVHQYFVPFRTAEIGDAMADTIGSFLGASIGARRYGG